MIQMTSKWRTLICVSILDPFSDEWLNMAQLPFTTWKVDDASPIGSSYLVWGQVPCHQLWGQLPGRKIHERRPLPMFGRMLFIFRLECLRKGKGVVFEDYKRWRMEVLKLGGCTKAPGGGRFNSLKKKTVRLLLWFHNFRSGELAKMGDGFGWPEQGTLLWKLKLAMALIALSLGPWQPQTSPIFEKRSTYVYFIFRLVHVLACSISIYTCYIYNIYMHTCHMV